MRDLAKALGDAGFEPWLDERELLAGDQLAKKIGEALQAAGALIVVVSEHSAESNWVSYELNLVADKLVKGDIRIIPVLIGESAQMPVELRGRLYADFRKSFKQGFDLVVKALDQEEGVVRHGWRASMHELETLVDETFGSRGWASMGGTFRSVDWEMVTLPAVPPESEGREIALEMVLGSRELTKGDFNEYADLLPQYATPRALLVSERPLSFLADPEFDAKDGVGVTRVKDAEGWTHMRDIVVVIVDLAGELNERDKRDRLHRARDLFDVHLPSGPPLMARLMAEQRARDAPTE